MDIDFSKEIDWGKIKKADNTYKQSLKKIILDKLLPLNKKLKKSSIQQLNFTTYTNYCYKKGYICITGYVNDAGITSGFPLVRIYPSNIELAWETGWGENPTHPGGTAKARTKILQAWENEPQFQSSFKLFERELMKNEWKPKIKLVDWIERNKVKISHTDGKDKYQISKGYNSSSFWKIWKDFVKDIKVFEKYGIAVAKRIKEIYSSKSPPHINNSRMQAKNTILFGSPGTGKTFRTKEMAVDIIKGEGST